MHKYVLFAALAGVLYVYRFDGVCCKQDVDLNFWKRDKKYDAVAKSKSYMNRRMNQKPKYRLHSAQRRWEKLQFEKVLSQMDRVYRGQDSIKRLEKNHKSPVNSSHTHDPPPWWKGRPANGTRKRTNISHPNNKRKIVVKKVVKRRVDKNYRRRLLNYSHTHGPLHRWKTPQTNETRKAVNFSNPTNNSKTVSVKKVAKRMVKRPLMSLKQFNAPVTKGNEDQKHEVTSTTLSLRTGTEANGTEANGTEANEIETQKPPKPEKSFLSPYSILKQMEDEIVPKFPDYNITVTVVGRTVEYNNIVLMKISSNLSKVLRTNDQIYAEDGVEKQVVFIVHGLSVMGFNQLPCMKSIDSILTLYSYYFKHLDKFDIFLMPMANPDGVAAAWMKSFWNKNMSPQSACPGVALDRNFDIAWNASFSKLSSCGPQYPGASPFSEAETQAIRDIFHSFGHKMVGYLNVHAGTYSPSIFKGDAVLFPKGFAEANSDDDKYIDLRSEVDEMMRNANFKVYSVTMDTLYNWYGKVYGTSVDYAAVSFGVPFSMELVMQLYDDDMQVDDTQERETNAALTEVWSRVIDIIFSFMHRTTNKNKDLK